MKPGPIIPQSAAPLRTLTVSMAVMCYLACLAIGALMLIDRAVTSWTQGLSREITVQLRPLSGQDIEAELAKAEALLKSTSGILAVKVLDRDAGVKLLEPWLGTSGSLDDLPVPRLIAVTLDRNSPPDLEALAADLKAKVQGASLDTHRRWQAELTRMAGVLQTLGFAVLILICVSAVAIVVFATRTVLDANRGIVDVLHLIGARDGFIARQVEGRFLRTGLAAGVIGMLAGWVTFFLIGLTGFSNSPGGISEASRSLIFAPGDASWHSYAVFFSVPVIATLISLFTARLTLIRMLKTAQ